MPGQGTGSGEDTALYLTSAPRHVYGNTGADQQIDLAVRTYEGVEAKLSLTCAKHVQKETPHNAQWSFEIGVCAFTECAAAYMSMTDTTISAPHDTRPAAGRGLTDEQPGFSAHLGMALLWYTQHLASLFVNIAPLVPSHCRRYLACQHLLHALDRIVAEYQPRGMLPSPACQFPSK